VADTVFVDELHAWFNAHALPAFRRAVIRARHRYAAAHPDRPRLRRMHAAYRARTRGRSRRG
jgi:hypothetical protein